MLSRIKWFTQRITTLLVLALVLFAIPLSLAKLLQWSGSLGWVDGLYGTNPIAFWVALVLSRAIYGGVWLFGSIWVVETGQKTGWFWFKPERSYYSDEPSVDKSGIIFSAVTTTFLALVLSELAIRIYTLTNPFYLG